MKKLVMIAVVLGLPFYLKAQQARYLVFEFIKVESNQMYDYRTLKSFMEKIYQIAVEEKKITGWDFWSLQSGADPTEFQCITITYFDDPVRMMEGMSNEEMIRLAIMAHPELTHKEVEEKFNEAVKTRDLARREYMVKVASTNDNFELKKGVLASFDLMKAVEGKFSEYERAEKEIFLPIHQQKIEKELMGSWSFLRTALPFGSEAKSTHMTMNIFRDYMQFFNSQQYEDIESTPDQRAAVEKGLKSREQKWIYLATLENTIR